MISDRDLKDLADQLFDSQRIKKPIDPLTPRYPDLTIEMAYKIQMQNVNRRVEGGERIIGKKIGLTSSAMQEMFGVYEPDYGHIFHTMLLAKNELLSTEVLQPKAEGEIAFVMREDIQGPGVTPLDVIRATDYIVPAIEIIDSRVKDWKIKIQDTIADNASSAYIAIGTKALPLKEVDMFSTGMVFCKNGEVVSTGAAAAVMGSPVNSVAWLANRLAEFGIGIRRGEIILSGSLVSAVSLDRGDVVEAVFDRLGSVFLRVV